MARVKTKHVPCSRLGSQTPVIDQLGNPWFPNGVDPMQFQEFGRSFTVLPDMHHCTNFEWRGKNKL